MIICTEEGIDTYSTEYLEKVKNLESRYDTPKFHINGVESSPCGRILVEF